MAFASRIVFDANFYHSTPDTESWNSIVVFTQPFFSGWPEDEGYYANSIIASRLSEIPLQNLLTYICLDFSLYLQGCSKSGPQVV